MEKVDSKLMFQCPLCYPLHVLPKGDVIHMNIEVETMIMACAKTIKVMQPQKCHAKYELLVLLIKKKKFPV